MIKSYSAVYVQKETMNLIRTYLDLRSALGYDFISVGSVIDDAVRNQIHTDLSCMTSDDESLQIIIKSLLVRTEIR